MPKTHIDYRQDAIELIKKSARNGIPLAPGADLKARGSSDYFPFGKSSNENLNNTANGPINPDTDVVLMDLPGQLYVRVRFA